MQVAHIALWTNNLDWGKLQGSGNWVILLRLPPDCWRMTQAYPPYRRPNYRADKL
jgi:hypothetical protein